MPSYDRFDVVVVPFPFTEVSRSKRRPALVLSDAASFGDPIGQSLLAMITSARHSSWPLDVTIVDLATAGLPNPSLVRMKLFTLDHRLILRRAGALGDEDREEVLAAISSLLGLP